MCFNKRSMVVVLTMLAAYLLIATVASGAEIQGKVLGQDDYGQPGVRVDFFGATKRVVLTDREGMFTLALPPGIYQVRVSSGMQRFESKHVVRDEESQKLEIKVDW